jgi:hypothetical protein
MWLGRCGATRGWWRRYNGRNQVRLLIFKGKEEDRSVSLQAIRIRLKGGPARKECSHHMRLLVHQGGVGTNRALT